MSPNQFRVLRVVMALALVSLALVAGLAMGKPSGPRPQAPIKVLGERTAAKTPLPEATPINVIRDPPFLSVFHLRTSNQGRGTENIYVFPDGRAAMASLEELLDCDDYASWAHANGGTEVGFGNFSFTLDNLLEPPDEIRVSTVLHSNTQLPPNQTVVSCRDPHDAPSPPYTVPDLTIGATSTASLPGDTLARDSENGWSRNLWIGGGSCGRCSYSLEFRVLANGETYTMPAQGPFEISASLKDQPDILLCTKANKEDGTPGGLMRLEDPALACPD
ncbi:hypothetical protein Pth03_30660 [Planotetraspora thailandica]|uniref:Uncharacterized protein n=1 Tax=Planotetraspora thailandica TaxID=487172 RepID=A0A8J3UZV1_9ACTN|nr:hypothetical protein [Planotetraspora thailandica]GII54677.1 hypothetical protein Pth03_30660 [Planotetraspora thailandica]